MKNSVNTSTEHSGEFLYYELSYSTAEIEGTLFQGEFSPEHYCFEIAEPEGEYRLIGDEIMRLDRQNLPPDAVIFEE